ncbi:MAG: hypothetical protein Q4A86_05455 [Clostridia bacterium]|nr:hypothetical protein [Clostridia bacterium]
MCAQIAVVFAYWFQTGWDSRWIIVLVKEYILGLPLEAYPISRYPNNTLMFLLYSLFYRFALNWGLPELFAYKTILVFNCFLSFIAGQLTFHSARLISGNNSASFLAFVVHILVIGLSPWVSIPYSDSLALLFPILILLLYLWQLRKNRLVLALLIGFVSCIGYHIKPTVAIVYISICLYEVFSALHVKKYRRIIYTLLPSFLGLLLGMATYSGILSFSGIEIDKEQSFGISHFFNMGFNEESMGVYSDKDVSFSGSFDSSAERNAANFESAKNRIKEMGFFRLLKHFVRKTLCTYNDGSFAWGKEGSFVVFVPEPTDTVISPAIRSFYYPDGERLPIFQNFEQALWLAILVLCCLAFFCRPHEGISVVFISLIGLFLYFMLFEVRARYVYLYAPFYILLAAVSLSAFFQRFRAKSSGSETASNKFML